MEQPNNHKKNKKHYNKQKQYKQYPQQDSIKNYDTRFDPEPIEEGAVESTIDQLILRNEEKYQPSYDTNFIGINEDDNKGLSKPPTIQQLGNGRILPNNRVIRNNLIETFSNAPINTDNNLFRDCAINSKACNEGFEERCNILKNSLCQDSTIINTNKNIPEEYNEEFNNNNKTIEKFNNYENNSDNIDDEQYLPENIQYRNDRQDDEERFVLKNNCNDPDIIEESPIYMGPYRLNKKAVRTIYYIVVVLLIINFFLIVIFVKYRKYYLKNQATVNEENVNSRIVIEGGYDSTESNNILEQEENNEGHEAENNETHDDKNIVELPKPEKQPQKNEFRKRDEKGRFIKSK